MRHENALSLAEFMAAYFAPACTTVEIVGSVRRGKPEVHDIELLMVPDLSPLPRPRPEFGKPFPVVHKTMLDQLVTCLVDKGAVLLLANGDRYKKLWHVEQDVQLDLFVCIAPSEYGVSKVIRTGPKDFSQWCVTNRSKGGSLPDGYFVRHQVVWIEKEIARVDVPKDQNKAALLLTDQNHLRMAEEIDFLNFLALGLVDPHLRSAAWNHRS
jgi:hypothetical protein